MTQTQTEDSQPLELRTLGTTGLRVAPLCIGCAALASIPEAFAYEVPEEQALATMRAIFSGPINFIDTAASYGDGESERRLGLVLRELGGLPPGFVLATKADRDPRTGAFSGSQMRRSVERSLRLLGLEQLQLVYLHDFEKIAPGPRAFDEAMRPGGPVETLLECKEEGLLAHLGVAGALIDPLNRFDVMSRFVETGIFEVAIAHNHYTLLDRAAGEFWDLCRRFHVAAVNAAPYASGILAKGPRTYPRYIYGEASETILSQAKLMEAACTRAGVPLAAAALQFSLRDPRITSTIVGITRPERLAATVELARHPIPEELWEELDAIFGA